MVQVKISTFTLASFLSLYLVDILQIDNQLLLTAQLSSSYPRCFWKTNCCHLQSTMLMRSVGSVTNPLCLNMYVSRRRRCHQSILFKNMFGDDGRRRVYKYEIIAIKCNIYINNELNKNKLLIHQNCFDFDGTDGGSGGPRLVATNVLTWLFYHWKMCENKKKDTFRNIKRIKKRIHLFFSLVGGSIRPSPRMCCAPNFSRCLHSMIKNNPCVCFLCYHRPPSTTTVSMWICLCGPSVCFSS